MVSICLPMQEMQVQFLGREDPLEKEMATHSISVAYGVGGGGLLWGASQAGKGGKGWGAEGRGRRKGERAVGGCQGPVAQGQDGTDGAGVGSGKARGTDGQPWRGGLEASPNSSL